MPRLEAVLPLVLICAIGTAFPAAAESPDQPAAAESRLQVVKNALEEGVKHQAEVNAEVESLSNDIAALRKQTIGTAAAIQDTEEGLSTIELQLVELNAEADAVKDSLGKRRGQYATMTMALARLARNPPEAALLMPGPPIDAMRGVMVLRAALPPVESDIRALGDELAGLAQLKAKIAKEQDDKLAATGSLKQESARLDALMTRMVALQEKAQNDSAETADRIEKLSSDAKDLKDLLARIAAQRPKEPAQDAAGAAPKNTQEAALQPPPGAVTGGKSFSAAHGSLLLPARGRIVKLFGQSAASGLANRGVTITTRSDARVVAPYDGQVAFAGPFRGYGQLLIIDQGEGYHILLAGLSRIDCVVGQWLQAGEPVGVMGPAENGDPQLYVELRHDGEPINPLPWMASHSEKVNG